MTTVLITGARGFIGRALTKAVTAAGDKVVCFNRSLPKEPEENPLVTHVQGDVQSAEDLQRAMDGVDVVYHLAAIFATRSLEQSRRVNVEGTRNVATAAARQANPPVVVYMSSLAACGPGKEPAIETSVRQPVSNYGKSKREAELLLQSMAGEIPITIVRPPCVFGQGDKNMLPLIQSVRKGWNVVICKKSQYSFVHVDDVVSGSLAAAAKGKRLKGPDDPACEGVYFLTDPQPVTFVELADMIAAGVGRKNVRHVRIPKPVTYTLATACEAWIRLTGRITFLNYDKLREGYAGSWTCSAARAIEELGFETPKPLSARIAETV